LTDPIAIPLNIGLSTGPQPTAPAVLRTALVTAVAATNPGYTANLPGTLIEDVTSTDMGAIITMDQARVDAVNSISPVTISPFSLAILGAQSGIMLGVPTNTSVLVVFSGPEGYLIPAGFIVGDGTYQYVVQSASVIGTGGVSAPVYCIASLSGTWSPAVNSVTKLVTSVPSGYTITVTNPTAGTAGVAAESVQSFRGRILQAQQASAQGLQSYLMTALLAIPGVIPNQTAVRQVYNGWKVIVGGGDPYAIAAAIYSAFTDIYSIRGSFIASRNVSISVIDAPNTYVVPYVQAQQQVVAITATYTTDVPAFARRPQVRALVSAAIAAYVNGIAVGAPLSTMALNEVFTSAVQSVLPVSHITGIQWNATVKGIAGESSYDFDGLLTSDPESYWYTTASSITVI
jgi:hypothetical protein